MSGLDRSLLKCLVLPLQQGVNAASANVLLHAVAVAPWHGTSLRSGTKKASSTLCGFGWEPTLFNSVSFLLCGHVHLGRTCWVSFFFSFPSTGWCCWVDGEACLAQWELPAVAVKLSRRRNHLSFEQNSPNPLSRGCGAEKMLPCKGRFPSVPSLVILEVDGAPRRDGSSGTHLDHRLIFHPKLPRKGLPFLTSQGKKAGRKEAKPTRSLPYGCMCPAAPPCRRRQRRATIPRPDLQNISKPWISGASFLGSGARPAGVPVACLRESRSI